MLGDTLKETLRAKAKAGYEQVNQISRGALDILVHALQSYSRARAGEAAASLAYYALFSLFPLLLFLVTIGSSILKSDQVLQHVLEFTETALPTSQELVKKNIQEVLARRGAVGLVAAVGLLWSATSVFAILARNINLAWHNSKPRNFLHTRLVGVMMVGILAVLLILLSLLSTTVFNLLPRLDVTAPLWGNTPIYQTYSWKIASRLIPWFFTFLMFLGLYRWVPNTRVNWSEAIWGALVGASGWEITKSGFTWYLRSGLAKYQLVYGSLGTVIALILWIYLSSVIVLFGAHLGAAVAHHRPKNK